MDARQRCDDMKQQDAPYRAPSGVSVRPWQCAMLALASGITGLITSVYLWWKPETRMIRTLGQQVGLFSAIVGIGLAMTGAYGAGKGSGRRLAILAFIVNTAVLCFTLDSMFHIVNW